MTQNELILSWEMKSSDSVILCAVNFIFIAVHGVTIFWHILFLSRYACMQNWEKSLFSKVKLRVNSLSSESQFILNSLTLAFHGLNLVRTEVSAHHGKGLVRTQTELSQFTLSA